MGVKIGCPALKLGTARSKNAGTRTAQMQGVLCEGWECGINADGQAFRFCKDDDYDVSKTAGNIYVGERNAYALGATIQSEAMAYSARRKAAGKRAMKSTAAIGFSCILKPPAEFVNALSVPEQERLAKDLLECFKISTAAIIAEDAINAVWQVDEAGGHWHIAGPAKLPSGEINADAIVNPKLYTALNRTLPNEMRQRGWDVSECVNYDPDKAKDMSEEEKAVYRAEAKAKRPAATGMSSKDFKAAKDAERMAELEARVAELEKLEDFCKNTKYRNGCTLYEHFRTGKSTPLAKKPVEAAKKPVEATPLQSKPKDTPEAETPPVATQKPSGGMKSFAEMKAEREARSKLLGGSASPEGNALAEQLAARQRDAEGMIARLSGEDGKDGQKSL